MWKKKGSKIILNVDKRKQKQTEMEWNLIKEKAAKEGSAFIRASLMFGAIRKRPKEIKEKRH